MDHFFIDLPDEYKQPKDLHQLLLDVLIMSIGSNSLNGICYQILFGLALNQNILSRDTLFECLDGLAISTARKKKTKRLINSLASSVEQEISIKPSHAWEQALEVISKARKPV